MASRTKDSKANLWDRKEIKKRRTSPGKEGSRQIETRPCLGLLKGREGGGSQQPANVKKGRE